MDQLVKTLDDTMGKESGKEKKMTKEIYNPDIKLIMDSIDVFHCKIKMISLGSIYKPNTIQHGILGKDLLYMTQQKTIQEFSLMDVASESWTNIFINQHID